MRVLEYCNIDTLLPLRLALKKNSIEFHVQLAAVCHTNVVDICNKGKSAWLYNYFVQKAWTMGYVDELMGKEELSARPWMRGLYQGAKVWPTTVCWIRGMAATVDFASLYPTVYP